MASPRIAQLRDENARLRDRLQQFQHHRNSNNLQAEILRFVEESKRNLAEMNRKVAEDSARQNEGLHGLTAGYEALLKRQIELLTENKALSEQKEGQDQLFNENVEKLTQEYEAQIKQFENRVKQNVKKIQDLSGGNIINRLLKNQRFQQAMLARGCSLEALEKQSRLEEVSVEVEEKEREIQEAEEKSARLDEELAKMHELIDTMKSLLENMMKEKDNILRQNAVLKEKLQQSEQLIGRLLGKDLQEEQEEEEEE